jgi:phage baseplate assembly protein W
MQLKDFDISMRKLVNGSISVKEGRAALAQLMQFILFTRKGEKLFDPNFGSDLGDYTEGSIDRIKALELKDEIFYALESQLRQVIILSKSDIKVDIDEIQGKYLVSIGFKWVEFKEADTINFTIQTSRN